MTIKARKGICPTCGHNHDQKWWPAVKPRRQLNVCRDAILSTMECGEHRSDVLRVACHIAEPTVVMAEQETQKKTIQRQRQALEKIARYAGMAQRSKWITRADAIAHIVRIALVAEEAFDDGEQPLGAIGRAGG